MTDVIIAPRREDPLSDVEAVISGGYFQLRSSYWNVTAGQWISDVWSAPIPFTGVAVTVKLDASTAPYDLYMKYPNGQGDDVERMESRIVVASGSPLKWEALELVGGAGAPAPLPSDFGPRLTTLEATVAAIGVVGGATSLGALTGASTDGKALIATGQTFATMRTSLSAASQSSVDAATLTANAAIPSNTLGTGNGPAKLSADGTSVLRADGTPFTGGITIGQVTGTAVDAGRYDGDIRDVPITINEGDPRYTNHPVTQRSCTFRGTTDPGNAGSRTLGGGGLAPPGVRSDGVPIIDVWEQVIP